MSSSGIAGSCGGFIPSFLRKFYYNSTYIHKFFVLFFFQVGILSCLEEFL